jgi:hypothetical protein
MIRDESAVQSGGEIGSATEHIAEGHIVRNRAIIEKQVDLFARRQAAHIRLMGVERDIRLAPTPGYFSYATGLMRSEYGESYTVSGEGFERIDIDCGFGQPHPFGLSAKSMLEVANAPRYLCRGYHTEA